MMGLKGGWRVGVGLMVAWVAWAAASAETPATVAGGTATAPKWKRTLEGEHKQPQTKVGEREWPEKEGAASVCLWQGDALAAFSHTIDDNNAMDIPYWLELAEKYKIKLTWFVITSNVDRTDGRKAQGGTWEQWRQVYAKGHDVQSHSVDHMSKATTLPADREYEDSAKAIEKNIPGDKCLTLANPGGGRENDHAAAMKYYIACRGSYPPFTVPGKVVYENTGLTSAGIVLDPKHGHYIGQCLDPKSKFYRSWYCGLTHFVGNHEDAKKMLTEGLAFVTKTPGEFWVGRYRDIVLYCMERDTHTLASKMVAAGKYEITLTCEMDPAIYDFPLTVKVRVGDGVKTIAAKQGGKAVEAKMVENGGHKYGLVEVVPNGGVAQVEAE